MSSPIYNVPLEQVEHYRGLRQVVRTSDPAALIRRWPVPADEWLCIQLTGLPADVDDLFQWGRGIAIDIVLDDPANDYAGLYRYAKLVDNHPVRVSLPVVGGMSKAVRLADSLQFAVKLEPGQPHPESIPELTEILDYYLYQATVMQPIDFFHEVLMGWIHDTPVDLWTVLDEDPAIYRYVAESGQEGPPPRLTAANGDPRDFVQDRLRMLIESGAECRGCDYSAVCRGYFKWPRQDYECRGVKQLLRKLRLAAAEIKKDINRYAELTGDARC